MMEVCLCTEGYAGFIQLIGLRNPRRVKPGWTKQGLLFVVTGILSGKKQLYFRIICRTMHLMSLMATFFISENLTTVRCLVHLLRQAVDD